MSSAAPVRAGIAFWIWALFVYFGGLKPYGFRVNHGPLGLSRVQCTVSISLPRRYDFIGRPRFVVRASLCFSLKISTHRSHTYGGRRHRTRLFRDQLWLADATLEVGKSPTPLHDCELSCPL